MDLLVRGLPKLGCIHTTSCPTAPPRASAGSQVVEMEMPAELAMAGAAYGYYSVVQDADRLEVGPAVPDAHVRSVVRSRALVW